jgi:hypothetical protein
MNNKQLGNEDAQSRSLTSTETLLLKCCDNERQAIALAPHVSLPDNATKQQIQDAVILALVKAKEAVQGTAEIEFISGQRRDLLREG